MSSTEATLILRVQQLDAFAHIVGEQLAAEGDNFQAGVYSDMVMSVSGGERVYSERAQIHLANVEQMLSQTDDVVRGAFRLWLVWHQSASVHSNA